MKVGTPLGEFPFEFRRVERREGGLAIVGLVGGLESSVVLERGDLRTAAGGLAAAVAALGLLALAHRARR